MNGRATAENKRGMKNISKKLARISYFLATIINLDWSFHDKIGFYLKAQRQNIPYFYRLDVKERDYVITSI